jgi:hypothetical protein
MPAKDLQILRDMAKRQVALSSTEEMKRLYREWEAFGSAAPMERPMVRMELWTFADDIIPQLLRCESEEARSIEWMMHSNVVNHVLFEDDTLVKGYIPVGIGAYFTPFGLKVARQETKAEEGGGLGHHFISQLKTFEEDFHLLGKSEFGIDVAGARARADYLREVFDGAIPVVFEGGCMGACLMQDVIHLMSMEDMYIAMCDEAELFHRALNMLTEDYIEFFEMLQREGALLPTNKAQHLSQGSYCFTDDLPGEKDGLTLKDLWIYMDSQETAGISPSMYREFVVPYYKKISSKFGLLSYGCCEAVHDIWAGGVEQYENIRKVSISPWCDEEKMGEILRGMQTVFLRKPTPNLIGVGSALDEDAVRAAFKKTARAARGCKLEIAQRDVYRINNTSDKVKRYVQLIRQTLEENLLP